MNISIVIPAYNEEHRIETSLKCIIKYLNNKFDKFEIIVVDDCSTDKTFDIISKYKQNNLKILRNDINRGKGYSVKRGIQHVQYPLVLFSDSDMATPINELDKFLNYITYDNYDIVIASRNLKESDIKNKQPIHRQIMGKIFPKLVSLILFIKFTDTQCGFKLFKTDVANIIVQLQTLKRFSFDVEMLFIANKLGYQIKEAPVVWIDREGSTVRTFKDGFMMLVDLFIIRVNNFLRIYSRDKLENKMMQ